MTTLFHPTLEQIYSRASACLEGLIDQITTSTPSAARWNTTRAALEALPLSTEEVSTARNRLDNARNYANAGEHYAARYELRLLSRSLTGK